jgi:hypothetical protein
VALQFPVGSVAPSATFAQVPLPQVWHVPHIGDEQQVPPTQFPLKHWVPSLPVQTAPLGFLVPQWPLGSQVLPVTQSLSFTQEVLHPVAALQA